MSLAPVILLPAVYTADHIYLNRDDGNHQCSELLEIWQSTKEDRELKWKRDSEMRGYLILLICSIDFHITHYIYKNKIKHA